MKKLADRIRAVADEIQPYCQVDLGPNELWNGLWAKLRGIANDIDALDADEPGLMDCKGYDLFPDGTMRPAHGEGEWVRAQDYDKLHAAAEAAQADAERYRWLRKGGIDHLLHGRLEELDDAIDAAMKECGK